MVAPLFFAAGHVTAAVVPATDCSSAAVQAAINSASNGDTVTLPGPCSTTWTTSVTIPNTKGITLDGNGAVIERGAPNGTALIEIRPNASVPSRVTEFNFTESALHDSSFVRVGGGNETTAKWRIDHNDFNSDNLAKHVMIVCPCYGVIDHNTFTWSGNNEVIHNEAYGAVSTAGWTNDVVAGSADAVYIEDNRFTNLTSGNPAYFWGGSAVQGYYGARTVFRHNYVEMATVDMHGTPGAIGARWWEVYENTFHVVPNGDIDKIIGMRGGSGVIFNNRKTGRTDYKGDVVLYEEDSGYPALYQVGRGRNQVLDPAYLWGNDASIDAYSGSSNVQLGRDFIFSEKPGYTPYTYPHPLVTAAPPASPADVRVVP